MLERAALHQTRFRTPGLSPDARGVVMGQKGVVLFPSLDRLVAFFRAYSDEGSLDELLPSLVIRRVTTPLRTRELCVTLQAESSYRLDRVAGVAKLAGGMVFTGTSRHFVKYRDASSPLGYDVGELSSETADMILYHDTFQQVYDFEREIEFADLVMKLTPFRMPKRDDEPLPSNLWITAEVGVGNALLSYMFRWQVSARAALAEWPSTSAFEERAKRLYVFEAENVPARVVSLFEALPGVTVFAPLGKSVAVQLGYQHPIALDSCTTLFSDDSLFLFRPDDDVLAMQPVPPFAPVRSLVRTSATVEGGASVATGEALTEDLGMQLPLRLAMSEDPWKAVVATVVPIAQREWLAKILYALPPNTLSALSVAVGADEMYLIDQSGIEGVPLGTFYSEVADRIFVPSGRTLVPAVSPGVLADLVKGRGNGFVFFDSETGSPKLVPEASFGPVSRRMLADIAATPIDADAPASDDVTLPLVQYGKLGRFPLWGIPKLSADDEPTDEFDVAIVNPMPDE